MKKRRLIGQITFAVSILCVCCIALAGTTKIPKRDFTGQPTYKVSRVIDGDTVELMMGGKKTTVRMIGVDTPETVHPRKPIEPYGKEASEFTTNLLKGEEVYIEREPQNTVDKNGRTLLYLYRAPDGLFVNLEIIRQGYGDVYRVEPFKYRDLFTHFQEIAQKVKKGKWKKREIPQKKREILQKVEKRELSNSVVFVYTTDNGKKYHTGSCRWGYTKITLGAAKKQGLTACLRCKPPR